jgi:hypothetical protein
MYVIGWTALDHFHVGKCRIHIETWQRCFGRRESSVILNPNQLVILQHKIVSGGNI